MLLISKCNADAFGGEENHPSGTPQNVPPNSTISIDLQLVSFKPVIDITGDSKVLKKILKEGEGAVTANEGASVTGKYFQCIKKTFKWNAGSRHPTWCLLFLDLPSNRLHAFQWKLHLTTTRKSFQTYVI